MATLEFYRRLDYDFSIYEGEESLRGLINEGFIGTESLCINEFNYLELNAARDVILCYLRPIAKINKNENSYSLKHIVEHILAKETNGVITLVMEHLFLQCIVVDFVYGGQKVIRIVSLMYRIKV